MDTQTYDLLKGGVHLPLTEQMDLEDTDFKASLMKIAEATFRHDYMRDNPGATLKHVEAYELTERRSMFTLPEGGPERVAIVDIRYTVEPTP